MRKITLLLILTVLFSCSKEEDRPCRRQDFLGTWEVKSEICSSYGDLRTIEVLEGEFSSRVDIVLGSDTLDFSISECEAHFGESRFLYLAKGKVTLEDNANTMLLEYDQQIAILWTFCNMELKRP